MEAERKDNKIRRLGALLAAMILFFAWSLIYTLSTANVQRQQGEKQQEDLRQELQKTAKENAAGLESYLTGVEEALESLSKSPAVVQTLAQGSQKGQELLQDSFEEYAQGHPGVIGVFLGTESKEIYLYPWMELPGDYDPSVRPWYTNAVSNKEPSWSEFYSDALSGHTIGTLSAPIFRQDTLRGVLGIDLDMDKAMENLKEVRIGKNGYLMVTDKKGTLLIHPSSVQRGMSLNNEEILGLITSKGEGSVRFVINGVQRLAAVSKVAPAELFVVAVADNYTTAAGEALQRIMWTAAIVLSIFFAMVISVLGILLFQEVKARKRERAA